MTYFHSISSLGHLVLKTTSRFYRAGKPKLLAFLGFLIIFNINSLQAEGTKQLAPTSDDIVMLLIGNGVYGNFGTYNGPANSRLYFNIKDPSELVYLGLSRNYRANGQPESTGSYNFQIRRLSDGAIVHGPFTVSSFTENVSSWEDAALGPAAITGQGYETTDDRFLFDPSQAGEYYIEFQNATHIGYWDITVASNGQVQNGRVYSTNWAFRTPTENNDAPECVWDREFNGILYSYTSDGFVTQIDFSNSGFQGLSFNVAFNRTGPGSTGDPQLDRMSVEGENLTENSAEHLIFLTEPDPSLYPDGECGTAIVANTFQCTPDQNFCLETSVTQPGQVEIVIDFNQNGTYDEGIDVRLLEVFDDPNILSKCIPWNGLTGAGLPPAGGSTVNLLVQYTQGVQHWALFDGEFLKNGFCVEPVRPVCDNILEAQLYWDDRNISADPGTTSPKDGRVGCDCLTANCRTWNNFDPNSETCRPINDDITEGYGDKSTLNTWWFARNVYTTITNIPFPGAVIEGESEICRGDQTTLSVTAFGPNVLSITWEGPDGFFSQGGSENSSVTVGIAGTYTATVQEEDGCVAFTNHVLSVIDCPVDVELDKSVDILNPEIGQLVNYEILVTNKGPGIATGIRIEDELPDGLSEITGITEGGVLNGNVIVWDNLSLEEGTSILLQVQARVGLGLSYTNLAEVTAMDQQDIDSTPGNGVDTNGNGEVSDDPGDEDDGDGSVLTPQDCSIGASVANIVCNDNGTPVDPSDDTFTFEITVNATNSSPGWAANDPNQSTGIYGEVFTFGPYPIANGTVNFTINDQFFGDCSIPISVDPPSSCSDQCQLETSVTNIICNDNGTPSDPDDDTYTFDLTVTGFNTGSGWSAGNTTGTYGQTVSFGPFPISGGATNLTIADNADNGCVAEIIIQAPLTCSGQCDINAVVENVICDDNGTPSVAGDDVFYFDLLVTGANTSETGWTSDNGLEGQYGVVFQAGPYPISDGGFTLNIQDKDEAACIAVAQVVAPPTCSDDCLIEANVSNIRCDDNGTLSDGTDDVYYFDVTVTGLNTGSGWTSNLGRNGDYGQVVTFGPYPIDGGEVTLIITDNIDANCTVSQVVTAPPSCSDQCNIAAVIQTIYCDDNGTDSNPADDVYYAEVIVSGANTSPQGFSIGSTTGQYDTQITLGPFPIADGNVSLEVTDLGDAACVTTINLTAPAETCSDRCEIFAEVSNIQCDDNGTPTIASDDVFTFDVVVTGFNFSSTWQSDEGTVGQYGIATQLGPFPISGGTITTNITDGVDGLCSVPITVEAPPSCSNTCEIVSNGLKDLICDDNGTPTDPSDDTYTFVLSVSGNNLSSGWSSNLGVSGSYDTDVNFGPYPISEGVKEVTLTDDVEPECQLTFSVTPPETCSDQCAIEASAFDILCLDNGTPSLKDDDVFEFTVIVNAINNPGSGWVANDGTSGNYGEAVTFGPYPISEGIRNLVITSIDFTDCQSVLEIIPPEPCSNKCLIEAEVLSVSCDDNGTPNTSTDDFYTYSVLVTGLNISDGWTASDGTVGTYGTAIVSLPIPVSNGPTSITITDNESDDCQAIIEVSPPPVEIECPEDAFQGKVIKNGLILEGSLEETDARFDDVESLCWLPTDLFEAGDHYYDLFTLRYNSTTDRPEAFTFYLFSDIIGNENFPLGLDGTGGVFLGPYYPDDPCCFLQTADIREESIEIGELLQNPQFDPEGLFSKTYQSIVKFTVLFAPNETYSLITTSLLNEKIGDYGWLILSDQGIQLELVNGDVTVNKQLEIPVIQDLTTFDRDRIFNNPASLEMVGFPTLDSYCGVDSVTFEDQLTDLGECENLTIVREFKVYSLGSTVAVDSCEQELTLRRPSLEDLVLPPETILYACDSDYDTLANGYPAPSSTGFPLVLTQDGYVLLDQTNNANLTVAYKDKIVDIPGEFTNTFRRDWTVIDVCNDTLAQYGQLIKIGGFTNPIIECPVSNHYCPIIEGNIMLFPMDPFECSATVEAPLPDILNTCDETIWNVRTEILQVAGPDTLILATFEPGEPRIISGLAASDYIFRYTVFDDADHVYEKLCLFRVADTQEPTAICQSNITYTLAAQGDQRVFVDDIDQGSYDNCGIAKVEIRRLYSRDPNTCDSLSTPTYSEWGDFVEVSCCDANRFITIEMRVTDISGLENLCWLDLAVENGSQLSFSGVEDIVVSCSDLPNNFNPKDSVSLTSTFGIPNVTSDCGATFIELKPLVNLSACGSGTITRRFQAADLNGIVYDTVFNQVITINEFLEYEIGFPADAVTDCINWADTLLLNKAACDSLEVSYEDVFLDPIADECYRISRTYYVISRCEWDGVSPPVVISRNEDCDGDLGEDRVWVLRRPTATFIDQDTNENNNAPAQGVKGNQCDGSTNPGGHWRTVTSTGYWSYTQEVRVFDTNAPVISFVEPAPICTDSSACTASIVYPVKVDDACVLETFQSFTLQLDQDRDGSIDADLTNAGVWKGAYPNFRIEGAFPVGNHEFILSITDFCGNSSAASLPVQIVDCFVPDPICGKEIVVNLEALSPSIDIDGDGLDDVAGVEVLASDLVTLNEEECDLPLRFSLNRPGEVPDINRTSISYTCDDRYSDSLEVFVWDSAANPYSLQPDGVTKGGVNYKSCKTLIYIQDPNDACPDCSTNPILGGTIATAGGLSLPVVELEISNHEMMQTQTNDEGTFKIADLPLGADYVITPHWDEGHRNGVSTMDLLLVRAHILGQRHLNSPYKMIAADVNNTGSITALDLIEIRNLLLGESDRFQNNTSWRFVDMHYVFPDVYNPWLEVFPESVVLDEFITCVEDVDFAAIKIGDVNESASFESDAFLGRTMGEPVILSVKDRQLRPGEEISLPVDLLDKEGVLGFQFTLSFNPDIIEVLDVQAGLLGAENVGTRFIGEGDISFSWDQLSGRNKENKADEAAFSLQLRAKRPVQLSEVFRISSRITPAEAYRSMEESSPVQLQFDGTSAIVAGLNLYQNRPNPFADYTIIGFDLPAEGSAEVTVMDISGRIVWSRKGTHPAGYNEMRVEASELKGGGMFYYSLRTTYGTKTKKFVVLNNQR